jgi:hypothetical protein
MNGIALEAKNGNAVRTRSGMRASQQADLLEGKRWSGLFSFVDSSPPLSAPHYFLAVGEMDHTPLRLTSSLIVICPFFPCLSRDSSDLDITRADVTYKIN